MKKIILFLVFLIPSLTFAQIPSYYDDVDLSQSGISLKNELSTKITSTHARFLSYSQVWDASKITDLDPDDPTNQNVILIYGYNDNDGNYITDRTRSKDLNGGTAGTDWNREHSYPKSLGNPNLGTSGPGSDAHHLRPSDVSFNGQRGSKKFATGSGNAGDSNGGWYPGDEWKGDVARMMMYMYLRYGSQCLPTGVGIGSSSSTPDDMIDLFLQWNAEDPVSQLEANRSVYHGTTANAFAQGNRNPFIDNPAFATQIWGGPQAEDKFGSSSGTDTEAPTTPTNLMALNTTQSTTDLSWSSSTDNIGVVAYDIYKDGLLINSVSTNSYPVTGLTSNTSYNFTLIAKDAAGNSSNSSAAITVTTLESTGSGTSSELFISEYVEGSSNNKAIEIANFTGGAVDLSIYSLKRNTNGGSSWGAGLNLSGQVTTGNVFVIAHSSATSAILNVADLTSSQDAIIFNGNDPVGLFKNNVLIDIIGNFAGGSGSFAANTTLRRKETVLSPTTSYITSEWDVFPTDTFSGLGSHAISGGTSEDTMPPTIPNGLTANNITETTLSLSWNAATDNIGVTSYDIFKDGIFEASTSNTTITITGLAVVTSYDFTLNAKDAAGNTSDSSTILSVTTVDSTAPSIPANLSATNTTQTTTILNWETSTDNVAVSSYEIYKNGVFESSTSSNTFTVTDLLANTNYNFNVLAKDAANNSSVTSNTVSVTTLNNSNSPDILLDHSFETGWNGWLDGGSDCYRINSSRSFDGNYSIRIRDNSGVSSSMTSSSYNVSSYDNLEVEFYFYSYSMETNEDFWLRYFDGSTWQTVQTYVSGTDFSNNGFYVATVNINAANFSFPSNAQFRFQCDASSNNDQIYIDKIMVTATTGTATKSFGDAKVLFLNKSDEIESNNIEIDDLAFYPNPARISTTIRTEIDTEDEIVAAEIKVFNLQGRLINKFKIDAVENELLEKHIDISNLPKGIYFVNISSSKGLNLTKKLIIK